MADFYFNSVAIEPNPVHTSADYNIFVEIKDKDVVLEDGNGAVIIDALDNKAILAQLKYQCALEDGNGNILIDADGIGLATRKEN